MLTPANGRDGVSGCARVQWERAVRATKITENSRRVDRCLHARCAHLPAYVDSRNSLEHRCVGCFFLLHLYFDPIFRQVSGKLQYILNRPRDVSIGAIVHSFDFYIHLDGECFDAGNALRRTLCVAFLSISIDMTGQGNDAVFDLDADLGSIDRWFPLQFRENVLLQLCI